MKKRYKLPLIALGVLFSINEASATIGYLNAAAGLKVGTAGAGSAYAMDATDASVNPALVAYLPNQFFISGGVFHFERSMDTTAATQVGNPVGRVESKTTDLPDGSLGLRMGDPCSCWSFAASLTGAGVHSWYPQARTTAGQAGNFDHGFDFHIANLNLAWAWCLMDGALSLGISPILSFQYMSSDAAVERPIATLVPNSGANGRDTAFGAGLRLGAVWKPQCLCGWTFSLTGQTPTYYQRFNKYRDLLISAFDWPANFTVGVAFEPWCGTTFLFDYQYIYFQGTRLLRASPDDGGFGWKNMNVFRVGLVQDICCFTARLGYSYAKSPINNERVFANVFSPLIVEHHIAAGLTYNINCCNSLSLSGYWVPKKTMTDSGRGGRISGFGAGTKIDLEEYDIQLAYMYKF